MAPPPAHHGHGTWPHMTFDDVPDEGLRAACVLVQDVAAALLAQLTEGELAAVSKRELRAAPVSARRRCGRC